jgi:membrane-associated phospholipid phosphatase
MSQNATDNPIPRTRSKAVIVFSKVASIILHPLFMTTVVALLLDTFLRPDFATPSYTEFGRWMAQLFLFTIVLPFGAIFTFKITGLISNAKMHRPRDRVLPLIATFLFYFLAYELLVVRYAIRGLMPSLLLGSCCAIATMLVVNFFYKVSVHTTAAAILAGICIVLAIKETTIPAPLLALAVLVALVVGAIRWFLGSHTMGQILLGYTVGILSQVAAYFIINT